MQNASLLANPGLYSFAKTVALIIVGFLLARFCAKGSIRLVGKYATSQQTMLLQKSIYFIILTIFCVAALQELGFKLSVILGSAGIATAALAFASQTSISNIISGIFLILEKSFQIGDRIKVGSTTGTITSIDLLSVKMLTSNNTLVRIPNENLIKSEITNITRFDKRRLDIFLQVSLDQDIKKVKKVLLEISKKNKMALQIPPPSISIQEFNSTGINILLSVWATQKSYDDLQDSLFEEIKLAFQENDINLSMQQQLIHVADIESVLNELKNKKLNDSEQR